MDCEAAGEGRDPGGAAMCWTCPPAGPALGHDICCNCTCWSGGWRAGGGKPGGGADRKPCGGGGPAWSAWGGGPGCSEGGGPGCMPWGGGAACRPCGGGPVCIPGGPACIPCGGPEWMAWGGGAMFCGGPEGMLCGDGPKRWGGALSGPICPGGIPTIPVGRDNCEDSAGGAPGCVISGRTPIWWWCSCVCLKDTGGGPCGGKCCAVKWVKGFSCVGGCWLANGSRPAELEVSTEWWYSPSSGILMVIKFVGRTADGGAPTGRVCTSMAGGLAIGEMDGGGGIPDACDVGSILGGRFGGLVPTTRGPCWVKMCCGGGSCCCGIPGGGRDTTIGGIAGPDGAVGWCGRNTKFEPSLIIVGIGWVTLYASTGPAPVGLAAPGADSISAGTTLGAAASRPAPKWRCATCAWRSRWDRYVRWQPDTPCLVPPNVQTNTVPSAACSMRTTLWLQLQAHQSADVSNTRQQQNGCNDMSTINPTNRNYSTPCY